MYRPLLVFIAELDMRAEGVAFFQELKHSFDMPKSTQNALAMRSDRHKQEKRGDARAERLTSPRPESLTSLLLMITAALTMV